MDIDNDEDIVSGIQNLNIHDKVKHELRIDTNADVVEFQSQHFQDMHINETGKTFLNMLYTIEPNLVINCVILHNSNPEPVFTCSLKFNDKHMQLWSYFTTLYHNKHPKYKLVYYKIMPVNHDLYYNCQFLIELYKKEQLD